MATSGRRRGGGRLGRVLAWIAGSLLALVVVGLVARELSPWPSALLVRMAFDAGGRQANDALFGRVPPGVQSLVDEPYLVDEPVAKLDVHWPAAPAADPRGRPAIIWFHGGAFLSGSKAQLANYLRILAAEGYVVVAPDYGLAPGTRYPQALRQALAAVAHVARHAPRLGIDPSRIFVAGDSAGAQLAAQLAIVRDDPAYAQAVGVALPPGLPALRGTILFCGPHDVRLVDFEGAFGGFMTTVLWSYLGRRDFDADPRLPTLHLPLHVGPGFPPSFISAGNADPLAPHSVALADALLAQGVAVDTLFFPPAHQPPLGHEYQFDLDSEAGALAWRRMLAFLGAQDAPAERAAP
jgi:acetyl esterase/lipase